MAIGYKSPGAIVRAVRIARANPDQRFDVPGEFPLYAADVLANFRAGLMKRCNRGLIIAPDDRFADLQHDARIINDRARGVRWSGRNLLNDARLARRYPEIHNPSDDDAPRPSMRM